MADLRAASTLLRVLADPTRLRLLHLLEDAELSVVELTRITGLAQSRVSSHLARLREAGLLEQRRDGTAVRHGFRPAALPPEAARLWSALAGRVEDPQLCRDRDRRAEVLRARRPWAETVAGRMEHHYSPGRTWESAARALAGLAPLGHVLDVASGDGALAELVAPRARSVTCLDASLRVAAAGMRRARHVPGLRFVAGDMHALPFADRSFDQVMLVNTLLHARQPARALAEAVRVLRPGGTMTVVVLRRHDHRELMAAYDHLQPGFEPAVLRRLLLRAGLELSLCTVTSRERRPPHLEVVTAYARRPEQP